MRNFIAVLGCLSISVVLGRCSPIAQSVLKNGPQNVEKGLQNPTDPVFTGRHGNAAIVSQHDPVQAHFVSKDTFKELLKKDRIKEAKILRLSSGEFPEYYTEFKQTGSAGLGPVEISAPSLEWVIGLSGIDPAEFESIKPFLIQTSLASNKQWLVSISDSANPETKKRILNAMVGIIALSISANDLDSAIRSALDE